MDCHSLTSKGRSSQKGPCGRGGGPMNRFLLFALVASLQVLAVNGHARLLEPPSRASAWRMGFDTPNDYNDNQGFCGGFSYQLSLGGKCGICGDPWGQPYKAHEAPGGEFATGTIVRTYKAGSVIPIVVEVTANHLGYFQFRLCANNNAKQDPTQECFDKTVLMTTDSKDKFYLVEQTPGRYSVDLKLPEGLKCSQCILQWTYTTGNSWGTSENGESCVGCGPQETFRACSDIAIAGDGSGVEKQTTNGGYRSTAKATTTPASLTTSTTTEDTTTEEASGSTSTTASPAGGDGCKAVGVWATVPGMNQWCQTNCNHVPSYCPSSHCKCE